MIGIQQTFQPKFLPLAKRLNDLGYQVCIRFLLRLSSQSEAVIYLSHSCGKLSFTWKATRIEGHWYPHVQLF